MTRRSRWTGVLLGIPLIVMTTACSANGADVVTVFSVVTGEELETLQSVFAAFSREHGIAVEVEGSRDFEKEIGSRIAAEDPPDIALFPQPSRILEEADELAPLPDDVRESIEDDYSADLLDLVRSETTDQPLAVPTKSDLKSVVWYNPRAFARFGYTKPTTFEEFLALADQMAQDGHPPFCVGLGSGVGSGWPASDWVEEFLLRIEGPQVYEQWRDHEIDFNHPRVVRVAEMVFERWSRPGYVFGGTDAATITDFQQAGWPMVDGECMMHRQANFYSIYWPDDAEIAPNGNVYAFRLPGSQASPSGLLTGGEYAAPFDESENTERVMQFLASPDFAHAMANKAAASFLSPHRDVDVDQYKGELTREFGEMLLSDSNEFWFDASDMMPSEVGSGTMWTAMLDITAGDEDVAAAFADVQENWPD